MDIILHSDEKYLSTRPKSALLIFPFNSTFTEDVNLELPPKKVHFWTL